MIWGEIDTPIGELSYAVDDTGVCAVQFGPAPVRLSDHGRLSDEGRLHDGRHDRWLRDGQLRDGRLDEVGAQLRAYFDGELTRFSVPLSVPGGSPFERAVWAQLSLIPYGETVTYGAVAKAVGDSGAARAVGLACNHNPIPVIVACHRVVGAGGKLVGFGGGLERKRILLELEANVAMQQSWR